LLPEVCLNIMQVRIGDHGKAKGGGDHQAVRGAGLRFGPRSGLHPRQIGVQITSRLLRAGSLAFGLGRNPARS
jgi:hypothetical protein